MQSKAKLSQAKPNKAKQAKQTIASRQHVNVEGLRTSSAGCPDLQRIDPPYAGDPGIEYISIASCEQVIAGGRRTSSAGFPDSQRIDILYSDCPGVLLFSSASSRQDNVEGLRASSADCPALQRIHLHDADCPRMLHIIIACCQQVNVDALRASSADCPVLQGIGPPYAGSPGIEHISIASCQQVLAGGRRMPSEGCPDLQCIDILYADCPGASFQQCELPASQRRRLSGIVCKLPGFAAHQRMPTARVCFTSASRVASRSMLKACGQRVQAARSGPSDVQCGRPGLVAHRPPYAGSPGIEHINIASSQQVIAGGRRTSSAGCPDSQCIDILYAD